MKFIFIFALMLLVAFNSLATKQEGNKYIIKGHILTHEFYPYGISSKEEWREIIEEITKVTYLEARGEAEEGWLVVVYSVITRLHFDGFPTTFKGVVNQRNEHRIGSIKCQYDAICLVDDTFQVPEGDFDKISKVVEMALWGAVDNPCPGAIYYYNPYKVNEPPHWATPETFVRKVGNHICHTA